MPRQEQANIADKITSLPGDFHTISMSVWLVNRQSSCPHTCSLLIHYASNLKVL